MGSAANNTSYTVLQASSHVFSQQEVELSLHFAFGNEFISVVNTVECFFISSLSLLSLSLPLFLSALYSFWPQPVAKPPSLVDVGKNAKILSASAVRLVWRLAGVAMYH